MLEGECREGLGAEQFSPLLPGLWVAGLGWPGCLVCSCRRAATQLVRAESPSHISRPVHGNSLQGAHVTCLSGVSGSRLTVWGVSLSPQHYNIMVTAAVLEHQGWARQWSPRCLCTHTVDSALQVKEGTIWASEEACTL